MATNKRVGDIDMSFKAEQPKPKPINTPTEVFEKDGHIIYKRDETGFMQFYDADKNPLGSDVIEKLSDAYGPIPEATATGAEKEGELKTRFIKYEKQIPKNPTDPVTKNVEVDLKDCDVIELRQYYTNGEAVIQTIPKKHYHLVKYLRGDYNEDEAKLKAEASKIEKEKVEEVKNEKV